MVAETGSRAVDALLFDWPASEPALKASRCLDCGALAFPAGTSCRRCGAWTVAQETLPRRGRLWTWTIQRFMPKTPYRTTENAASFTPYGVGYIELPGALCIESRLTESDPRKLRIGLEMELVIYPQWLEENGIAVMSFAFSPIVSEHAGRP
jgi:uncharacterized OB-fold protein